MEREEHNQLSDSEKRSDVTRIINAIQDGDPRATDELLPLVYDELRMLAAQKLSQEKPGQTLQATALVHEAYLRLVGENHDWDSRGHFYKAAAEIIRRITIENARHKNCLKKGGQLQQRELDSIEIAIQVSPRQSITLDESLSKLSDTNSEAAEIVKLRYFAGLTLDQIAEIQGISRRSVTRIWTFARAWLYRDIEQIEL